MELLLQDSCCDNPRVRFVQSEIVGIQIVNLVCTCAHIWRPINKVIDYYKITERKSAKMLFHSFCCDEPRVRFVELEIPEIQATSLICICGHIWWPTDTISNYSE